MEELKPQAITRYTSIVASIANEALKKVEGVTKEDGVVKYRLGLSGLKNTNCHVYIDDEGMVWCALVRISQFKEIIAVNGSG